MRATRHARFRAAMKKGRHGERYLLGAANWTFSKFFGRLERLTKVSAPWLALPSRLAITGANLVDSFFKQWDMASPVEPGAIEMAQYFWYLNCSKASSRAQFQATRSRRNTSRHRRLPARKLPRQQCFRKVDSKRRLTGSMPDTSGNSLQCFRRLSRTNRFRIRRYSHVKTTCAAPSPLPDLCLRLPPTPRTDDAATRHAHGTHARTGPDSRVHGQSRREQLCSISGRAAWYRCDRQGFLPPAKFLANTIHQTATMVRSMFRSSPRRPELIASP